MSTGSPIPTTDSLPNYIGNPNYLQLTFKEKIEIILKQEDSLQREKLIIDYFNNIEERNSISRLFKLTENILFDNVDRRQS